MGERDTPANSQIDAVITRENGILLVNGTLKGEKLYVGVGLIKDGINPSDLYEKFDHLYPVQHRTYGSYHLAISHSPNFELHDDPIPSQSADRGSETGYAGQTSNKEAAVQLLEEMKVSKPPHGHNGPEIYEHVAGELAIRMLNPETEETTEKVLSELNQTVTVPEGYIHQVKSLNGLAISVLVCDFTEHNYHPELNLFDEN